MKDQFLVDEVVIEPDVKAEDELLLIKKINYLLEKLNLKKQRICILICLEEIKQEVKQ